MIEKWKVFTKAAQHSRAQPIVAVENVSVIYNTTHALDNISFRLEAGERVAVVGPNGAGKSTLFKVIAGLLAPTRGKTHISGSDPSGHICIAYIPQRSQVDWAFPVNVSDVVMMGRIRNIGLLRHAGRSDYEAVREALQVVGMENLATRQIGELSGGQQQRVFIARALAQEAELMLLDEPLTGLDVRSQEDIMAILEALHGRVTVMIATHDLSLAATSFDRLMLLNHRLIGFGTAQEVLTTERLAAAYGGHMHVVPTQEGLVTLDDACCDGGHTHHD